MQLLCNHSSCSKSFSGDWSLRHGSQPFDSMVIKGSGGEGGFEPPVQLLTVQRFSKFNPPRPCCLDSVS